MRKYILLSLLLSACLSVHSQNDFATIKDEVNSWYKYTTDVSTSTMMPKTSRSFDYRALQNPLTGIISGVTFLSRSLSRSPKSPKTINFAAQHYSLVGIISNGELCEGTIAKFYETSSPPQTLILEGKVSYSDNKLIIKGIKYVGTNKIYGTFYVYNMDDFSMKYKPKKGGALRIKCSQASYLEGFYLKCPVLVRLDKFPTIYVDGKTGGRGYSFLSAVIPSIALNDDDTFDMYQILLQTKKDVIMCWEDGAMFKGKVKPTIREDSAIIFRLLEGEKTGMTSGPKKITVRRDNNNIVYIQEDNDDDRLLSKETLYVKDDGRLPEMDYWNVKKIYENCDFAKWTYRNGNCFEGKIKSVITESKISSTATNGVFKYSNGDRFEGNISTKKVGPFFIDGTTILADGTILKGNWLENYKLSDSQWAKVYKCKNPSSARSLVPKLIRSNNHIEYEYSGRIDWFDPKREYRYTLISNNGAIWNIPNTTSYITYNKTKKRYSCRWKRKEIELEFAVDNKGLRKWEIVYGDNHKPEFINEFTWYSNGVIESIKSYNYKTKKIYLSCNFFSDGSLKSAYQYGLGNSGENILRKSKESHPTYGGYTCKLYDLNGKYERSIRWDIGDSSYGGSAMTPSKFNFEKLKPIVEESDDSVI